MDLCCGSLPLANTFPALFSHVTRPNASVARVLSMQELDLSLCPRLSCSPSRELLELQALVSPTMQDNDVSDVRIFHNNQKHPTTKEHYMINFSALEDYVFSRKIWHSTTEV